MRTTYPSDITREPQDTRSIRCVVRHPLRTQNRVSVERPSSRFSQIQNSPLLFHEMEWTNKDTKKKAANDTGTSFKKNTLARLACPMDATRRHAWSSLMPKVLKTLIRQERKAMMRAKRSPVLNDTSQSIAMGSCTGYMSPPPMSLTAMAQSCLHGRQRNSCLMLKQYWSTADTRERNLHTP
ncbi:MAG: hypothetical protein UY09_C0028G0011 [Parcubacteria group bacterium GW2011_GWA2_47_8]|nr:MAG: hypothetical protein UY09_C0028G0011 [Parcubacteria group bacterium GW2011_GWA2_47_8]